MYHSSLFVLFFFFLVLFPYIGHSVLSCLRLIVHWFHLKSNMNTMRWNYLKTNKKCHKLYYVFILASLGDCSFVSTWEHCLYRSLLGQICFLWQCPFSDHFLCMTSTLFFKAPRATNVIFGGNKYEQMWFVARRRPSPTLVFKRWSLFPMRRRPPLGLPPLSIQSPIWQKNISPICWRTF